MTSVLGLPLGTAEELLKSEGIGFRLTEISSRKGSEGTDFRVIGERTEEDGSVLILYAGFQTAIKEE